MKRVSRNQRLSQSIRLRKREADMKKCKDCKKEIPELEAFPGPRCLDCHSKWFDTLSEHAKPDFVGAIAKRR